jgi:hypothetical protein
MVRLFAADLTVASREYGRQLDQNLRDSRPRRVTVGKIANLSDRKPK